MEKRLYDIGDEFAVIGSPETYVVNDFQFDLGKQEWVYSHLINEGTIVWFREKDMLTLGTVVRPLQSTAERLEEWRKKQKSGHVKHVVFEGGVTKFEILDLFIKKIEADMNLYNSLNPRFPLTWEDIVNHLTKKK